MADVQFTPDLNPSTVRKTVEHLAPHTAGHLNRIQDRLVGGDRVLRGLELVHEGLGSVTVLPGAFVAGGVIVDLLLPATLSYADILVDGALPRSDGRTKSLILFAYCEDAKASSEIRFGFCLDSNIADIEGVGFVVLGVLTPSDEESEDQLGVWVQAYGYSADDLARDVRDGVQNLECVPMVTSGGAHVLDPDFKSGPYFLHERELLVFADRYLIPSRRFLSDASPGFTRRGLTGITSHGFPDLADYDSGGQFSGAFNLTAAKWSFVVNRDIAWQEVQRYPSIGSPPAYIELSRPADAARLLVFENGLWIPPSEVTLDGTKTQVSLAGGLTGDSVYHFVQLSDLVFYEEAQVQAADLAAINTPQNFDITLEHNAIDINRNTVLVFLRPTAPGTSNYEDGGYVHINRTGYASRDSQGVRVENGYALKSPTQLTLRGLAMGTGAIATVGVLCLRGSTPANTFEVEADVATSRYRSFDVVAGTPSGDQVRGCEHMVGVVLEVPSGGSEVLVVGLPDVAVATPQVTPKGSIEIAAGYFAEFTLEQAPSYENDTSQFKSPRRVTASTASTSGSSSGLDGQEPAWGPGFGDAKGGAGTYYSTDLTVAGGAQAATVGLGLRLRAGRLVENIPQYPMGQHRLRVALDGVVLVLGKTFEERTTTSIVVHAEMLPGSTLEAWVE